MNNILMLYTLYTSPRSTNHHVFLSLFDDVPMSSVRIHVLLSPSTALTASYLLKPIFLYWSVRLSLDRFSVNKTDVIQLFSCTDLNHWDFSLKQTKKGRRIFVICLNIKIFNKGLNCSNQTHFLHIFMTVKYVDINVLIHVQTST